MNKTRRSFLKTGLLAAAMPLLPSVATSKNSVPHDVLLPKALKPDDTIGLITPASPLFEAQRTLMEAQENLAHLGFKSRAAKNIFKKHGYLAGTVEERVSDLHDMFLDPQVKAIMTIRGGYGSAQLLPHLDYEVIKNNPKILIGYSDITSLLAGIHSQTGLVTFHGPVAVSTFTNFTKEYFFKTLTSGQAVGLIDSESFASGTTSIDHIWTLRGGRKGQKPSL